MWNLLYRLARRFRAVEARVVDHYCRDHGFTLVVDEVAELVAAHPDAFQRCLPVHVCDEAADLLEDLFARYTRLSRNPLDDELEREVRHLHDQLRDL